MNMGGLRGNKETKPGFNPNQIDFQPFFSKSTRILKQNAPIHYP